MREEHEHYTRDRPRPPARMSLPEFPQIDLRRRRRRPRVSVPQAEDVRPVPPARARGPRGGRAVCQVASRTRPDVWYTVYVAEGGTLFCACPDFVHRRRLRGEECKHLCGLPKEYGFSPSAPARTAPFRCRPCLSSACPAFSSVYESRCLSENRQGDPPDTFGECRHRFQPTIRSFAIQNRWL